MAGGKVLDEDAQPFTTQELLDIAYSRQDFRYFLKLIFPKSFTGQKFRMADGQKHEFSLSAVHYAWAEIVQKNPRVCILAPRMHLKSTILTQAYTMWLMFKSEAQTHGLIISYKEQLAQEHTKKIKDFIRSNPYFRFWIDNKHTAESVINYTIRFSAEEKGHVARVDPYGVLSGMRGLHPNFAICDDILSDFSNPLEPTQIYHIDDVFRSVIESLPDESEPLVVVGTPQSYEDTLYLLRYNKQYLWARFPAELDNERTLWPEKFDRARLERTRTRLHRKGRGDAYQVEYLLIPRQATMSFLDPIALDACIDMDLSYASLRRPFSNPRNYPTYAGVDVGKNAHPSHISVGIVVPGGDIVQIYEQFLDGEDYNKQAKQINRIMKHFNVKRLYFDNTRNEMDDRFLSKRAIGKSMSNRWRGQISTSLEARIYADENEPGLVLLANPRQTKQMLAVDKQLKSIETAEGHGDSFWSVSMMCQAAEDGPTMQLLGDGQGMVSGRVQR